MQKTFEDIFEYVGIELNGVLGACSGEIPVCENEEVLQKAYEMGKNSVVS